MKKRVRIAITILFFLLLVSSYWIFSRGIIPHLNSNQAQVLQQEIVKEIPPSVLLGSARLSYAGGAAGRGKNIELGMARIDGTVVSPGEEFSFGKALGSVSEADGFTKQRVFLNSEVSMGLGGGLCQVSTILFQSILSAGLPVTERRNHTYSVSYYDTGLDATFADPGPDLKFVNDTAYPITIRGRTENSVAIFEIYGVSDGRQVTIGEAEVSRIVDISPTKYIYVTERDVDVPECVNSPQIGYTAHVPYDVLYSTGVMKKEVFTSTYQPLQRVCHVVVQSIASTTPERVGL